MTLDQFYAWCDEHPDADEIVLTPPGGSRPAGGDRHSGDAATPDGEAIPEGDGEGMTASRHCCKIGCDKPAEFEITAVRGGATGSHPAGPDPYSDYTDACTAHIGELLGHQPNAAEPENIFWEVRDLASRTHDKVVTT